MSWVEVRGGRAVGSGSADLRQRKERALQAAATWDPSGLSGHGSSGDV